MSGGKDSYALLDILLKLKARAPIHFDLVAVNLDKSSPAFPEHAARIPGQHRGAVPHRERRHLQHRQEADPEGKTTCSLCSRLRRGILYRVADELGCTKIALGHHRDDILQTLLLNMFFGGKMKSMPPKLVSDDGKHVVIRPLAYVAEKDTARWAAHRNFPIIPCNLCGSQENLQRKQVGEMLREWEKRFPGRVENMFNALQNVVPRTCWTATCTTSTTPGHRRGRRKTATRRLTRKSLRPRPRCPACRWCRSVEESLTQLHALTA